MVHTFVISALWRQRQNYCKFKAMLGYLESSKSTWAVTQKDFVESGGGEGEEEGGGGKTTDQHLL